MKYIIKIPLLPFLQFGHIIACVLFVLKCYGFIGDISWLKFALITLGLLVYDIAVGIVLDIIDFELYGNEDEDDNDDDNFMDKFD